MEQFRFIVEDIMSRTITCEDLDLVNWSYDLALNRPGSLTGSLPITSLSATTDVIEPWRRAIYVERDGRIDWGGILVKASRQTGSPLVQLSCVGWLGYWDARYITTSYLPTGVDQFDIFRQLITDAQDETIHGTGFDLDIGAVWTAPSGVLRDRTDYLPWKQKKIGDALRELAGVDNGFDFASEHVADPTLNRISRDVRLFYPAKGRDTRALYEFSRGQPSNIVAWGTADSGDFAWVGDGWGDGSDATRLRVSYVDDTSRGVWPPVEASVSFSGTADPVTLAEHTAATFGRTRRPATIPVIRVDPVGPPAWGDFGLGDRVTARIDDGFGSIPDPTSYRVIGMKVTSAGVHELALFDPRPATEDLEPGTSVGGGTTPGTVTPPIPVPPPTELIASPGSGFVVLTWGGGGPPAAPTGLVGLPLDGSVILTWVDPHISIPPPAPLIGAATPGTGSVTITWT